MTEYNGWANWETWNVALWFDNDEALYHAKEGFKKGPWAAAWAKAFAAITMPDGTPDMDDTDGGYAAVDWDEIAASWNE